MVQNPPPYPPVYTAALNRGHKFFIRSKFSEAVVEYTAAIELSPDRALAYSFRAMAWEALGETENAELDRAMVDRLP